MARGSSIRARAPKASSPRVRQAMEANYGPDLRPEQALRKLLCQCGLRFRKNCRPIPEYRCTADLVFFRMRVCVFVDGCFWHGCPKHFACPKKNGSWWAEKIWATKIRDKRQRRHLRLEGWKVIRVWEHEIERNASQVKERIIAAVRRNDE